MSNENRISQLNSIQTDFESLVQHLSLKSGLLGRTKAKEKLSHINEKINTYGNNFGHKDKFLYPLIILSKEVSEIIDAS